MGVVQADALGSDPAATVQALERLEQQLPEQIEAEARWLEHWRQPHEPAVIVADVPPAAARLAGRLGWPLLWHGNFGWDSIYADLGGPLQEWAELSLADYRCAQAVLRCPFALPMPWGVPQHPLVWGPVSPAFSLGLSLSVSIGAAKVALGPALFWRFGLAGGSGFAGELA